MKVAVIGAGIGGMAAAIRIAAKGHSITLYDKNPTPGGKLSQISTSGYRFDTGPSLFTLPELVDELFQLCEEDPKEWLQYEKLPIVCKYFFPDGSKLNFYQDLEKLEEELETFSKQDILPLKRYLKKASEAYQLSSDIFIFNSLHKLSNYNTPPYKRVLFKLHKLDF